MLQVQLHPVRLVSLEVAGPVISSAHSGTGRWGPVTSSAHSANELRGPVTSSAQSSTGRWCAVACSGAVPLGVRVHLYTVCAVDVTGCRAWPHPVHAVPLGFRVWLLPVCSAIGCWGLTTPSVHSDTGHQGTVTSSAQWHWASRSGHIQCAQCHCAWGLVTYSVCSVTGSWGLVTSSARSATRHQGPVTSSALRVSLDIVGTVTTSVHSANECHGPVTSNACSATGRQVLVTSSVQSH